MALFIDYPARGIGGGGGRPPPKTGERAAQSSMPHGRCSVPETRTTVKRNVNDYSHIATR